MSMKNFRNNANEQYYNDQYYASGTMFDNLGRRMANGYGPIDMNVASRQQGNYQYNGNYNDRYRGVYNNQPNYNSVNVNDAQCAKNKGATMDRAMHVEQIVYNSAVLSGTYHNLRNPTNDVRDFTER